MPEDDKIELTRTEARGGSSTHVTRYVLPISLVLVIVVFLIILYLYR